RTIKTLCFLAACVVPLFAYADDDGTLVFSVNGDSVTVTGCVDSCPEALVIPSKIQDVSVTQIGSSAFSGATSLTSVTLPGSVTSIAERAFQDTGLTSITIPDTVVSIGGSAFYGAALTSLTLGSGVTTIGDFAFWQTDITSLIIPDSVTSIGRQAFGDTPLKTLVIGNGLSDQSSVGREAFLNVCQTLESVAIDSPGALGRTGSSYRDTFGRRDGQLVYFTGYAGLHFGRFYDNTTRNYSPTAYQCPKLETITLGDNVVTVGDYAFDAREDLSSLTSVTLGAGVTDIGASAFAGASNLVSLTIPDSVVRIGANAFQGATRLTSLTLGAGLLEIGSTVFNGATSLTSVTLPDSLTTIGSSAFSGATNLVSINLPDSVTSIADRAFQDTGLTSITIPDAVVSIGNYAFQRASLTSLTLGSGVTTIGDFAFWQTDITSLIIPDSVTSIGRQAFGDIPLKTLVIGNGLSNVGGEAFLNACQTLESVAIDSAGALGRTGSSYRDTFGRRDGQLVYFTGYAGLHFGRFYDNTTRNYSPTAYQCPKLETITLGDNVVTVGDYAFDAREDLSSLTFLTVPSAVQSFGVKSFNGMQGDVVFIVENTDDATISTRASAFNLASSFGDKATAYYCLEINTDGDRKLDCIDPDDDNDGILDDADKYPLISLAGLADTDGNGVPDTCDNNCLATGMTADQDDDGDG
ncbi:leucine-rich repeat domain-containing protein, partial [Pseudomonadales bacterium]|nr:leucine-rich repeat domain-containing protein [Pseudomonadales bacterium]